MGGELVGDRTAKRWSWHPTVDRVRDWTGERFVNGDRYHGVTPDGEDALLFCVPKLQEGDRDDLADLRLGGLGRARLAVAVADIPAVAASEAARRLLDVANGEYGYWSIWEYADRSLLDHVRVGDLSPSDVEAVATVVDDGLSVLHDYELAHCDIAPNNVLRVGGTWKLGDLDSCTPLGERMRRFPPEQFAGSGARDGAAASPELDAESRGKLIAWLREQER